MMHEARMLYPMVTADFRERTRRYSFLITLLGTVFFGFLVITGKWVLLLGEYRGEYNSAWVGSLMGSAATCMLAFFGFYLVKNSLGRDRRTGVGEILAATPVSSRRYMASKFLSNLAVLVLMAATLGVMAIVMQWLGPSETDFDLWALVAPFVFVCVPVMALVAGTALLFESVAFLRGTLGNIVYFFLAEAVLVGSLLLEIPLLDLAGLGLFIPSMEEAALAAYPNAKLGLQMGFVGFVPGASPETMKVFHWDGIDWSLGMLPIRFLWIGAALSLAALATVFFDRFDPARAKAAEPAMTKERIVPTLEEPEKENAPRMTWSAVSPVELEFSFWRMWRAELVLMVKGYHASWYGIALGLLVAQWLVPYGYARGLVLSVAWVWPLAMWSSMGTREARFNTGQIVFSSAFPETRQFPAMWMAGLTVALVTGSGMMGRAFLAGELHHLGAMLVGALFVPSLALFLGVVSGTKKVFEVGYLLLWYMGPVNHLVNLDFLGATEESVTRGMPQVYLVLSLALLVSALLCRRREAGRGR